MKEFYTWEEVLEITLSSNFKDYGEPLSSFDFSKSKFKLEHVWLNNISSDYLTIDECRNSNFEEDEYTILKLVSDYDRVDYVSPIILDSDFKVINGRYKLGALDYLSKYHIEVFLRIP